ncbi:MAG: c-type cytochrome biogenesis protein CcmI [Xanthobacteraceae bacterium]
MMLWLIMALMTAAAVFSVLWPLARRTPLRTGSDLAVYRDQLDEIERDRSAGLIGEREAEAARVEVSRRLIAAADAATPAPAVGARWRRRAVALAALILLPMGTAGLYLALGAPGLPGQPQATRRALPPENRSITELVGRVEAHLEQNPEDGRGWEVLAPVYLRLGRFDDAVSARRNVLRLLGANADREADLGEALTVAANGIVTAEANEAFVRALRLNPDDFRARYFLGLAAEQDGRPQDAAEVWRKLLTSAPADAAWIGLVRESLARVDPGAAASAPGPSAPGASAPGPSADDVAAAAKLAPEQRMAMVRGMVERLAEQLKQDGSDMDGWLRLVRAYMVLGEKDKARAALGDARRALAREPDKLRRMDELSKGLGLEG